MTLLATTTAASEPAGLSDEDLKISLWDKTVSVRGGFGYKDNVLLSSSDAKGSGFWSAGGDVLVFRLPTSGWTFNAFASADYTGYVDKSTEVDHELNAVVATQVSKQFDHDWRLGLGANYLYVDQVLDLTRIDIVGEQGVQTNSLVQGHTVTGRLPVRKELRPYWLEAEPTVSRQWLAEPLDDFWQTGVRVTGGRYLGANGDLSLSYQWSKLLFDTRETVTSAGVAQAGTHLRFQPQSAELTWRQKWDQQGHWESKARVGLEINQDNGSGYFDYWQYFVGGQLKYHTKVWEIGGQVRFGYYDFPVQTIGASESALRRKALTSASVRAERTLWKGLKIFAAYAFDYSESNATADNYRANTVSGGASWEF